MSKVPPPLLGFNNNVRHRGRIFHIQTEDSGIKHPRLVTHLFADGGRIVKTTRTDYAEHIGRADMTNVLRQMMKEQHKAMFIALRAGELDDLIVQCCGPLGPPNTKTPPPATATVPTESSAAGPNTDTETATAPAAPAAAPQPEAGTHQSLAPEPATEAPTLPRRRKSKRPAADTDGFRAEEPSSSPNAPRVTQRRRSARPATPDLEPVPPPPTPTPSALYAAARPAAIFEPPRAEPPRSIFGESMISEKSLDEVILSYLAEDLEENTS